MLERGLTQHPEEPALLTRLAFVELQLGRPEVALELSRRAITRLGDGRGEQVAGYAYADMGHALALTGRKDEARAAFAKAADLGVSVEDRLLLLADPRAKKALEEAQSPILRDVPPSPPLPPPPLASAESGTDEAEEAEPAETDGEVWAEDEVEDEAGSPAADEVSPKPTGGTPPGPATSGR